MAFFPRSSWATSNPSWTPMPGPQPHCFIHHVGGGCPSGASVAWLRQFEQDALRAGAARGDHYIAVEYHLGVFLNGDIAEFRPNGAQGGATKNNNGNSYALCLMGDFRTQPLSPQMIASVQRCITLWKAGGQLAGNAQILPHSAVYPTACPGDSARAALPQFTQLPTGDDMFEQADRDALNAVKADLENLARAGGLHDINARLVRLEAELLAVKAKLGA